MPSLPAGASIVEIARSTSGQVTLAGVGSLPARHRHRGAGGSYQRTRNAGGAKKKLIKEFNFKKGILVATFSGIMSACFAFALQAGKPINEASLAAGTNKIWTGLPALTVLLLGGFTTNFLWCVWLNFKNKTGYQYFAFRARRADTTPDGRAGEPAPTEIAGAGRADLSFPVLANYFFPPWPASAGISNFSSTRWARPKWAITILPPGRCTWPASSFSARCGVGFCMNGKARAKRRICSSLAASARLSFPPSSSAGELI